MFVVLSSLPWLCFRSLRSLIFALSLLAVNPFERAVARIPICRVLSCKVLVYERVLTCVDEPIQQILVLPKGVERIVGVAESCKIIAVV